MKYNCPHCNAAYEIEQEHNGKHFQCAKCQKYFVVAFDSGVKTSSVNHNTKKCPMCYGEINAEAFKCMHCGEILRTKSGRPPVDRVGYLIWGLTFGMIGAHYLYAKRTVDFLIHLVLLILTPIAALTIVKIFDFESAFLPFLILFEIAFAVYTMNTVAKDPNR